MMSNDFWVYGVVFGLVVWGVAAVSLIRPSIKWESQLTKISIYLISFVVIMTLSCSSGYIVTKNWNGGYCRECSEEWHLTNVTNGTNRSVTKYLYTDSNGHSFISYFLFTQ